MNKTFHNSFLSLNTARLNNRKNLANHRKIRTRSKHHAMDAIHNPPQPARSLHRAHVRETRFESNRKQFQLGKRDGR